MIGTSDVGYVTTPTEDAIPAPRAFGSGPGQVGGFELHDPLCRELCYHRIAPDGPIIITRALPNRELTWVNITPSATYVVRGAADITGPWSDLVTIQGTTFQSSYTLPASVDGQRFYTVAWTDAVAPGQPIGGWDYQAFDKSGFIMAAGVFGSLSNLPSTGGFSFSRIQSPAQNPVVALHPQGQGSVSIYSVGSPNTIELFFSNEFRLRGQMLPFWSSSYGDYFAGDWFATDSIVNPPPGTPPFIIHSGRFVALRHY